MIRTFWWYLSLEYTVYLSWNEERLTRFVSVASNSTSGMACVLTNSSANWFCTNQTITFFQTDRARFIIQQLSWPNSRTRNNTSTQQAMNNYLIQCKRFAEPSNLSPPLLLITFKNPQISFAFSVITKNLPTTSSVNPVFWPELTHIYVAKNHDLRQATCLDICDLDLDYRHCRFEGWWKVTTDWPLFQNRCRMSVKLRQASIPLTQS